MIKACVFDIDGTLFDTLEDIADSLNRSLMHFGFEPHEEDAYRKKIGGSLFDIVKESMPKEEQGNTELINKVCAFHEEDYLENLLNKTKPFDGIVDVLEILQKQGVLLNICSNKPDEYAKPIFDKFLSHIKFDYFVGSSSGLALKPDPEGLFHILDGLNLGQHELVYIGDSDVDVFTAKRAGVDFVGVAWGLRGREELKREGSTYVIDNPYDIVSVVNYYYIAEKVVG